MKSNSNDSKKTKEQILLLECSEEVPEMEKVPSNFDLRTTDGNTQFVSSQKKNSPKTKQYFNKKNYTKVDGRDSPTSKKSLDCLLNDHENIHENLVESNSSSESLSDQKETNVDLNNTDINNNPDSQKNSTKIINQNTSSSLIINEKKNSNNITPRHYEPERNDKPAVQKPVQK